MIDWSFLSPKDPDNAPLPDVGKLWRGFVAWVREFTTAPVAKVVEFYSGDISIYPLVFIRIGLGLICCYRYSIMLPEAGIIFGEQGLMSHVKGEPTWVMQHLGLVYTGLMIGCVGYLLGAATRVSGALIVAGHIALHYQTWTFAWGDGTTGHLFVFYTLLGNPGGRMSVDAWIRKRRNPDYVLPETTVALAPRLLMMHITAIYFMAAWNRVLNLGWLTGRMTFVALNHGVFSRMVDWDWNQARPYLWLGTWYTWLVELAAPLMLWLRKPRVLWVFLLMAMHLGLQVTSIIGMWQLNMLTILWVFLPAGWSKTIVHALERRVGLFAPSAARPRPETEAEAEQDEPAPAEA